MHDVMDQRGHVAPCSRRRIRSIARHLATAAGLVAPTAEASIFAGEALDAVADYIALFVIVVVPIALVAIFWFVHILPEKVAEQRQHPQKDAIKALCLLSLVFGGLLWPIAWIVAYSKPVLYKLAYGRDRHDDHYRELAEPQAGEAPSPGASAEPAPNLPAEISELRERLRALEARAVAPPAAPGAAAGTGQGAG